MLLPVFHFTVVGLYGFSLWYDQNYVDLPSQSEAAKQMPLKGRLMFLTIWSFILQTVYFALAFLNDIAGTNAATPRKTSLVRVVKDAVFSLALPIALFVSSSFWSLYYIDKELVFPEVVERVFPVWLNHTLHTFISVFILTELLLTNRNYPPKKVGCTLIVTFSVSYIVWLHILFERTGAWVYPIFAVLNLPQRIAYLIFSAFGGVGLYLIGEKLNSIVSVSSSYSQANGQIKRKNK